VYSTCCCIDKSFKKEKQSQTNYSMNCVLLIVVVAFASVASALNNRPVIGILTQPTDGKLTNYGSSCERVFGRRDSCRFMIIHLFCFYVNPLQIHISD
jgi:hypothetical protein